MNTGPKGRQNQQNRPEEEVTGIIPVMTQVMTEVEEILDKGHMIETEEGSLHCKRDPEITIIQEGHTEDKISIEKEVTVGSRGIEVNPDH